MNLNFGVPKKNRKKRVEKYPDTAVMTLGIAGDKGTARKMYLNKKACEMLDLDEKKAEVAFVFDTDFNAICNADHKDVPEKVAIRVTKNYPRRISDKSTYSYLIKTLELDDSVENELFLYPLATDNGGGITLYELSLNQVTDDTDIVAVADDFTDIMSDGDSTFMDNQVAQHVTS